MCPAPCRIDRLPRPGTWLASNGLNQRGTVRVLPQKVSPASPPVRAARRLASPPARVGRAPSVVYAYEEKKKERGAAVRPEQESAQCLPQARLHHVGGAVRGRKHPCTPRCVAATTCARAVLPRREGRSVLSKRGRSPRQPNKKKKTEKGRNL
ncbi:hypothetical protein NDU88_003972 [Pleurodeles waltl]|uniref:Uncharacterized protein n=1 Tax=Pleurodeles waltl TaxID=8319 RepID=A0AAV7LK18_PLEWA|nr:hypothetical protein NDU88_003972 [Pleurodeles waltl]